jgi:PAS domain S-box-containing protein
MPLNIKPVRGYHFIAKGDELKLDHAKNRNTSEGVVVGNAWGYISDVNDVILSMFGVKEEDEFVGKNVLEFLLKEEKERAIANSLSVIEEGKARVDVYTVKLKNGKEAKLQVLTDLIEDEDGQRMGFIDIIRPLQTTI